MATDGVASKDQVAQDNWDSYVKDRDAGHSDYVEEAEKYDRFYVGGGGQWEEDVRQKLEAEGRPVLEINMILSTVNAMLGEHSTQRGEIIYKPRVDASEETAAALTQVAMYVQDDNRYEFVEHQLVADGLIQDRGYLDVRVNFDNNLLGEIEITVKDPTQIVLDADAKDYDPKTWNRVTETRWLTLDEVEIQYGKEARKEVESRSYGGAATYGADSVKYEGRGTTFGTTGAPVDDTSPSSGAVKYARLIERQWYKLGWQNFFVDNATGDQRAVDDELDKTRMEALAQALNLSIVRRLTRRVRWTVSIDNYVVSDDWSPYRTFTIIPFFPYFRRGRPFGVVRNLVSPQEQLNKIESQSLHVVNTTANSGWVVESGSLQNMTTEELESRGAETGLVLVFRSGKLPPQKIPPNQIPSGLDNAAMKSALHIKTISGVNDSMLGTDKAEVSGVAMDRKLSRGSTQLQVPFTHLGLTRQLLGEKLLELIREFYTEERIFRVIDYKDPQQREVPVAINQPQPDGSILNDVTVGTYRVVVSVAPPRDNFMETQFAEALQMREVGVYIPDDVVISNSHLARKNDVAQRVREMQGMGDPTPEQMQMQQMQQEIMVRMAMAELSQLEAKSSNLQSQAMLNQAKAGQVASDTEVGMQELQADMMLEIQKLKQKWAEKLLDLESKMQLANVHTDAKMQQVMYQNTGQRFMEELSRKHEDRQSAFDAMVKMALEREKGTQKARSDAMALMKEANKATNTAKNPKKTSK
jgi:hypothetical protein